MSRSDGKQNNEELPQILGEVSFFTKPKLRDPRGVTIET